MPTLPRTTPNPAPPGTEVHVFASRFGARTWWGALKFLMGTPAVWRQVSRAPGAYGATLRAKPLSRTYWTLSAWESPTALGEFARAGVHSPVSRNLSGQMRESRFLGRQVSSDELPLDWDDAIRRLA
ncbi:DUF3291 domain-containing protein [Streptomyces sp. NPDC005925]|uniref:DUF3291 domain-containing protein n=1 Tax=Streptomyces sp. NPDC005925 TaxID=3157172 RepID=UPI0033E47916